MMDVRAASSPGPANAPISDYKKTTIGALYQIHKVGLFTIEETRKMVFQHMFVRLKNKPVCSPKPPARSPKATVPSPKPAIPSPKHPVSAKVKTETRKSAQDTVKTLRSTVKNTAR